MVVRTLLKSGAAAVLSLTFVASALGYQQPAHQAMTVAAAGQSVLSTSSSILPLLQCSSPYPDNNACSLAYVQGAMGQAAYDEDDGKRGLAHFFDAQNGGAPGSIALNMFNPLDAQICAYLHQNFDLIYTSKSSICIYGTPVTFTSKASSEDWILSDSSLWQLSPFFHPDLPLFNCDTENPVPSDAYCDYVLAKSQLVLALTAPSPLARQLAGTTLFFNLGHVLHHIQDQAQPQHVRNDSHCDFPICQTFAQVGLPNALGAPSAYEAYTGVAVPASIALFTQLAANGPMPLNVLPGATSSTPTFALPTDFWSTGGTPPNLFGIGMSEFASYNFLSVGTGPTIGKNSLTPDPAHPQPSQFSQVLEEHVCTATVAGIPAPSGPELYLTGSVIDQLGAGPATSGSYQSYSNVLLGTISAPSLSELATRGLSTNPHWTATQNCVTYDRAMYLLVPQAIRYSAWFIDFMFRGSISATLTADGTLSITNNSQSETLTGGYPQLYADDGSGVRSPAGGTCAVDIPPGATVTCVVAPLPAPAPPSGNYLLVYTGTLGQEAQQVAYTSVAAPKSWDANADFSVNSNPNGPWTYLEDRTAMQAHPTSLPPGLEGWSSGLPVPDAMVIIKNITNSTITQSTRVLVPGLLVLDPEADVVAVSFTAPMAGTYNVQGKFTGADSVGNPHPVEIWLNAQPDPLWDADVLGPGDAESFTLLSLTLSAGDTLYFQVDTGFEGVACTYCYLSTGFDATITLAPQ